MTVVAIRIFLDSVENLECREDRLNSPGISEALASAGAGGESISVDIGGREEAVIAGSQATPELRLRHVVVFVDNVVGAEEVDTTEEIDGVDVLVEERLVDELMLADKASEVVDLIMLLTEVNVRVVSDAIASPSRQAASIKHEIDASTTQALCLYTLRSRTLRCTTRQVRTLWMVFRIILFDRELCDVLFGKPEHFGWFFARQGLARSRNVVVTRATK